MRRLFLLFSLVILLFPAKYALADTEVSGDIPGNTVWTAENSPYVVTSNVNVLVDATLTIEAGVTVKFNPDTRLNVYGILTAEGLSESLVTFTSNEETKNPGDWYGIILYSDADDSDLSWCVIEYANTGLTFSECSAVISDSFLRYCSEDGISVFAETDACKGARAEPTITRCVLENNTLHGISYNGFGGSGYICIPSKTGWVGGTISESTINNNGGAGISITAFNDDYSKGAASPEILSNDIFNNESGIVTDGDGRVSPTISENRIYGNSNSGILNQSSAGETIIRDNTIYDNEGAAIHNFLSPILEYNIINEKNSFQPGALIGLIELSEIYSTNGLAFDGNNFYTRPDDHPNDEYKIHKYDKSGNLISSFDSPINCVFRYAPNGMVFDGSYFWVASYYVIHKFDTDWNLIDTIPCPVRRSPGLAYDGNNLWIVEENFSDVHKIHKLDASGNIIDSIDYGGFSPKGIAFDGTYLWCADRIDDKIYKMDTNGNILESIDTPGVYSKGLEFDGTNLWVYSNKIYKLDLSGNILGSFDAPGNDSTGIAYYGNSLWIADKATAMIYQVDTNGNIVSEREFPSPCVTYGYPEQLTFGKGHLWTITGSQLGGFVNELDMEGNIISSFRSSFRSSSFPAGFGFEGENLWIGNTPYSSEIEIFDTSGNKMSTLTPPVKPYGLDFDNDDVWIVDTTSWNTFYKLDKELNIITTFELPFGTYFEGMANADGYLSIIPYKSREIYQITTNIIAPITGSILTEEGYPVENVCVEAISIDDANRYLGDPTDSNGEFTIIAPPLRDYYIKTDVSCTAPSSYGDEWWDGEDGIHDQIDAMVVSYTIDPIVAPIHFTLIQDADNDGVGDSEDLCLGHDDSVDVDSDGTPDGCDSLIDSDGDSVSDNEDQCSGHDDTIDVDSDGIPDGCDALIDSDGDGVSNDNDQCSGYDDAIDVDSDGVPDGCDALIDSDGDGVADSVDICPGHDDNVDSDNDGTPDGCDDSTQTSKQGFDYLAYLSANPDLPPSWNKAECMNHYKLYGFAENRAVTFNLQEYLNANPDFPTNWTLAEGLNHYNMYGKFENRLLAFDAPEYLSLYPDLPQSWSYDEAYAHFVNYGQNEGRIASFDETAYLELYEDFPSSWGQDEAFYHYIYFGKYEGRVYDPYDEEVFSD